MALSKFSNELDGLRVPEDPRVWADRRLLLSAGPRSIRSVTGGPQQAPQFASRVTAELDRLRFEASRLEESIRPEPQQVSPPLDFRRAKSVLISLVHSDRLRKERIRRILQRFLDVDKSTSAWSAGSFDRLASVTADFDASFALAGQVGDGSARWAGNIVFAPLEVVYLDIVPASILWSTSKVVESAATWLRRALEFAALFSCHVIVHRDGATAVPAGPIALRRTDELDACTAPILRHGPPASPAPCTGAGETFALAA